MVLNSFADGKVLLDDNLTGTGIIGENHESNSAGPGLFLEINGSVGSGLIFALEGGGPPEHMQIDQPNSFNGTIDLSASLFSTVTLLGLHVTSADLVHAAIGGNEAINMYNGTTLVENLRIGGNTTNLYVQQTATGVVVGDNQSSTPIVGNVFHS